MKTFTRAIIVSSLFSLFEVTNCVASYSSIQRMRDIGEHFDAMKRLCEQGTTSLLEFAESVVCVFQDQATEERGLVDILCEQCEIPVDDEIRIELIAHCLRNPSLKDVPVLVLDIPENSVDAIYAPNDLYTHPHPEFCQAVIAANNLEEVIAIFDTFDTRFETNPEVIAKQSKIYARAAIFRVDIPRGILKLMIGEKEFSISRENYQGFAKEIKSVRDIFQVVLDYLQASEEEGGAGLDEANAFHIFKQIALAYRGQNGTAEGHHLISIPLVNVSNVGLLPKFNGVEISMKFEDRDDLFVLVEKTECSPILGIKDVLKNRFVTSELRFKFPGDLETRTGLPITSTRIFLEDETIELDEVIRWRCPFRENPPRKIIIYGGND